MNPMDDARLIDIADRYGTTTYVFDADEVQKRAVRIREIMNEGFHDSPIKLCYSIKANPFLIPALMSYVNFFEVCSPGELQICKRYEVPGSMIIYSGVYKDTEDIEDAINYGAAVLTAESLRHYELITDAAKRLGKRGSVLPRLTAGSQFGMSEEDLGTVLSSKNDLVDIIGIHYFTGTQREKLNHQIKELEDLKDVFVRMREASDLPLQRLEYGPGLPFPYFESDDLSDTLRPVKELAASLREAASWCDLTVEMGRFLASSCGYYLARVVDIKQSAGRNWCIMDGGINHINYLGSMMGMKIPVIKHFRSNGEAASPHNTVSDKSDKGSKKPGWALCGSLCTTNDVVVRDYTKCEPAIGDLLVFCNIGAYAVTEAMGLFLSRDLPKVVILEGDADYLTRDTVPSFDINSADPLRY